jgi:hypothetical protein
MSEDRIDKLQAIADAHDRKPDPDCAVWGATVPVKPSACLGLDLGHGADRELTASEVMRKFESGATRDTDNGKHDPEAFLSPLVIERYNEFMHLNRKQKDGTLRDGDNWQKGMPLTVYAKSMWRHFLDFWKCHRGLNYTAREDIETALCAIMFNAMGYLHEILKTKHATRSPKRYGQTW